MLLLWHNTLSAQELFIIERLMLKMTDTSFPDEISLEFNVFDKSRAEIYGYILGILQRLKIYDAMGITPSEFLDFLIDIDYGYLPNAYHSFFHAADVTIVLYHLLCHFEVSSYLSAHDMAILLIAGLCHDIGHPGKNNNYQVNLQTELAVRYENKSVLESYSCTLTMDLLTKHKLLRHVEKASAAMGTPWTEPEIRSSIIKMILATDMIFHYELQENLTAVLDLVTKTEERYTEKEPRQLSNLHDHPIFLAEQPPNPNDPRSDTESDTSFDDTVNDDTLARITTPVTPPAEEVNDMTHSPASIVLDQEQRDMLCQVLIHAADISNAVRSWPICQAWSNLVCEEFFRQGEAEKEHGLPVSPNMDRDQISQSTISLQFGDFVVYPYFELIAALFPKADDLLRNLAENRKEWLKLEEEALASTDEDEDLGTVTSDERSQEGWGPLPSNILPDRPIVNPSGRRVSVAAGMVVIPEELEKRTVGYGRLKRTYWGVRSVSVDDPVGRPLKEEQQRRKSAEPSVMLRKLQLSSLPHRPTKPVKRSYSTAPEMFFIQ
ncbi:uncharacterized protein BYT42DRAFT_614298 [Radiomyces spectabilis]|uniref:uncharacterized protein n=1 Tax=Radiomyces spectabilis TaxID=64574 RepID=UPI00221ED2F8|nr:uncharacterized protein BYT42DRAFT_614298 [Radiomyces spectabilis]KAI8377632.1 hypothetical protein BYT42DRAFT_614298 [Radiomyces spectabilis]